MRSLLNYSACFLIFIFLAGCASSNTHPAVRDLQQQVADVQYYRNLQATQSKNISPVTRENSVFIGTGKRIPLSYAENLPAVFHKQLTMRTPEASLFTITSEITRITKTPVRILPLLSESADTSTELTEEVVNPEDLDDEVDDADDTDATSTSLTIPSSSMRLEFSGTLIELLDLICAHYQYYWEYDEGAIQFFKHRTRTFSINALPGTMTMATTLSSTNSESSESSSQSSYQKMESELYVDLWSDLSDSISSMLSSTGHVTVSGGSGTITVSDAPSYVKDVETYLEEINRKLSKQVAISVNVYSVITSRDSSFGFDLDTVFTELSDSYEIASSGLNDLASSSLNTLSATILDGISSTSSGLSQLSGSALFVSALQEVGDTSLLTNASGITLNNRPMPIYNMQSFSYLASKTTSSDEDGNETTELELGEISTGFAMTAIPAVLKNDRILLQLNVELSNIEELTTYTVDDAMIQAPTVNSRSFVQRVSLKPGSTLVLSGLQQFASDIVNENGILSVSREKDYNTTNIIITVTANLIDGAIIR
jgi:type IVB pilus formation R64 PilN family outer membrane protein